MINFKNEKGASSVLVIIMMVVLLVFGLAVLTTSLSNVRLSDRKKAWLEDYYTLEADVETTIANYDGLLKEAEFMALAYIDTNDYEEDYMIDGPLEGPLRQQVFAIAYHDYVVEFISNAIAGDENATFYVMDIDMDDILSGELIKPMELTFDVASKLGDYPKHIQVSMAINGANPLNINEDMSLINRYSLVRYKQWQDAFEYDDSIDFDDPFDEATDEPRNGNPFDE